MMNQFHIALSSSLKTNKIAKTSNINQVNNTLCKTAMTISKLRKADIRKFFVAQHLP